MKKNPLSVCQLIFLIRFSLSFIFWCSDANRNSMENLIFVEQLYQLPSQVFHQLLFWSTTMSSIIQLLINFIQILLDVFFKKNHSYSMFIHYLEFGLPDDFQRKFLEWMKKIFKVTDLWGSGKTPCPRR